MSLCSVNNMKAVILARISTENMKKTELPPEKAYIQLTTKELDSHIKQFQDIIDKFNLFIQNL